MQLIQAQTLAAAAPNVNFSNIPQTYSHLFLIFTTRSDYSGFYTQLAIQLNGDTGANYDGEHLYGTGGAVKASADVTATYAHLLAIPAANATANCPASATIWIPNYGDTTFFKIIITHNGTFVQLGNSNANLTENLASLWRSTAAINQITLFPTQNSNFVAGSIFSLYGT